MRLIITKEQTGDWAAYYIAKTILEFKPSQKNPFTLGIPGGLTPLPMYWRLVSFYKDGVINFEHVHFFSTGDYIGLPENSPYGFSEFIHEHFFQYLDIPSSRLHFLNGSAKDLKQEAVNYEELIQSFGGIRLWVCGLGDDAHVAFNEPGSSLQSRTRDKELTFETRVANAKFFNGDIDQVPFSAMTIGLGTLLDAQEIIVLAQGHTKAQALALGIEGGVNHMYPVSVLQLHPKLTFVADEEAVSELRVRTYRYHKEVEKRSLHPKILIKGLYKAYYALTNARIFDGERFIESACIIIENDIIKSVEKQLPPDTVITKIDMQGRILTPGYIDLQLNGCGGADVNDDISLDTLKVMYQTCLKHGVTNMAPTLITTSDERMLEAIDLINYLEKPELLGIIAWHFEGPYLSPIKKGVHEQKYIRKPSQEMLDRIIQAGIARKIVTLAPEENTGEDIKKLADAGIIVSMGHTNGTYDEINQKIPFGITMVTHLYNAMRPFDSREPGALGAVLDSKTMYAGIIADGVHCNYASVDIAYKTLGERLFLVSDAVLPAGTDMEFFTFAGRTIAHRDGKCFAEDGTLSGAATMLDQCVRNVVNRVGIPIEHALKMASTIPAQSINLDHQYGYIKPGYKANITVLDENLFVKGVIENGRYLNMEE